MGGVTNHFDFVAASHMLTIPNNIAWVANESHHQCTAIAVLTHIKALTNDTKL